MTLTLNSEHTKVNTLGGCTVTSPLTKLRNNFVDDNAGILSCSTTQHLTHYLARSEAPPSFEQAGPRKNLFFDPETVTCGIVTCGGLCPGLNDVIRSVVMTASYSYGVKRIYGFRYGYAGLAGQDGLEPILLTPDRVERIHEQGGTLLGSSRGPQEMNDLIATLVKWNINILFAVGGDGTLRGANRLNQELRKRQLPISIIGIPKTIDNDIDWIERSFGFSTAVEEAVRALQAAHAEARGAYNGIGLVKLMGRHSGAITAHASLANSDVNFCLIPEAAFTLRGKGGFLDALEQRLNKRHHAVIAIAEGAAQGLIKQNHNQTDASGNVKLGDVGIFLRDKIKEHFKALGTEITIKYIDPSYIIRSLPANAIDSEFCLALGQHAVHAGMAGRTNIMIGFWNQYFTHVPIPLATEERKEIDVSSELWQRVLGSTGQTDWAS